MSQTSCDDIKDSISQSDVSITEQTNEMSKTDTMTETELLTTDWERLDRSIFCFKIHKKKKSAYSIKHICLIFRKKSRRNCHGRNIDR